MRAHYFFYGLSAVGLSAAGPVAGIHEVRDSEATAVTTISACAIPSGTTQPTGAATTTIRAKPTSFKIYDASSDSYVLAHKAFESDLTFGSATGGNFGLDSDTPSHLQILDYGSTNSDGTFQPDYAGQEITGVRSYNPEVRHVNSTYIFTDQYYSPIRCHITFSDDGSCPLLCRDHSANSWNCGAKQDWLMVRLNPQQDFPGLRHCQAANLYAVTE